MRQRAEKMGKNHRVLAAAAAAILAALMVVSGPDSARASAPAGGDADGRSTSYVVRTCEGGEEELTAPEYESLQLHNEAREGAGLGHLCVNSTLTDAARNHASDMLERDYFGHDSPEGTTPIDRMEAEGYSGWSLWGENLGWGSGFKADSKEIFAALMNSPGHRANILKDGFLEVGIGAVGGEFNGRPGAGMYAMDFGARAGQGHEYPEVLSEEGGGAERTPEEAADDDPLAGVTVTPQEQQQPEEQPTEAQEPSVQEQTTIQQTDGGETGGGDEKAEKAQAAVCETFGKIREQQIGSLRQRAEDAAGGDDPASQIIAETNANMADRFEESFLNPPYCDFGGSGRPAGDDAGVEQGDAGGPASTEMGNSAGNPAGNARIPAGNAGNPTDRAQKTSGANAGANAGAGDARAMADRIREQVLDQVGADVAVP